MRECVARCTTHTCTRARTHPRDGFVRVYTHDVPLLPIARRIDASPFLTHVTLEIEDCELVIRIRLIGNLFCYFLKTVSQSLSLHSFFYHILYLHNAT